MILDIEFHRFPEGHTIRYWPSRTAGGRPSTCRFCAAPGAVFVEDLRPPTPAPPGQYGLLICSDERCAGEAVQWIAKRRHDGQAT